MVSSQPASQARLRSTTQCLGCTAKPRSDDLHCHLQGVGGPVDQPAGEAVVGEDESLAAVDCPTGVVAAGVATDGVDALDRSAGASAPRSPLLIGQARRIPPLTLHPDSIATSPTRTSHATPLATPHSGTCFLEVGQPSRSSPANRALQRVARALLPGNCGRLSLAKPCFLEIGMRPEGHKAPEEHPRGPRREH